MNIHLTALREALELIINRNESHLPCPEVCREKQALVSAQEALPHIEALESQLTSLEKKLEGAEKMESALKDHEEDCSACAEVLATYQLSKELSK